MSSIQTWGEAIGLSLLDVWGRFVFFLPSFIGAVFVFVFGIVVAVVLGRAVEKIIKFSQVDKVVEQIKLRDRFKKIGIDINVPAFFGGVIKWFFILVFLMAATDILGLSQVTYFLNNIIFYIPNIVVAIIILSVAFVLGNFSYSVVRGSTQVAGIVNASVLAIISKWAVIIFGLLAALIQLGIATSLVNTIFIGIVAALSLAIGLAFGLGGKEEAALVLRKFRENVLERK